MLKFLIMTTLLMMFVGSWEVVQFFLFVISFFISLKCAHDFFCKGTGMYNGCGLSKVCSYLIKGMNCSSYDLLKTEGCKDS